MARLVNRTGEGGDVPYGNLSNNVNQFMSGQALLPYTQNLPGYANMVGKRSETTQQMLGGDLPDDVINQIMQQAAERGISGGAPGSQSSNAAYLRALGLNSLGMMQQGSQQLSQSIADTPVPELWNPMAMHVPVTLANMELAAARAGMRSGGGGGSGVRQVVGGGGGGAAPRTQNPYNYPGATIVSGGSFGGIGDFAPSTSQSYFNPTAPIVPDASAFSSSPSFNFNTPSTNWMQNFGSYAPPTQPLMPAPRLNDYSPPSGGSSWAPMGGWSSTLGGGLGSSMYGSNDSLLRSPAASSGGFQDFGFGGGGGLLDQVSHDFGGGGGGFFD